MRILQPGLDPLTTALAVDGESSIDPSVCSSLKAQGGVDTNVFEASRISFKADWL